MSRLDSGGLPANGFFDLAFSLFATARRPAQVGVRRCRT
jgi:hypothetical protein